MADASVSGADVLKDMWVQVPPPAYIKKTTEFLLSVVFLFHDPKTHINKITINILG